MPPSASNEPPVTAGTAFQADSPEAVGFIARAIGWILVGAGTVGLVFATLLAIEKYRVLEDPSHIPACSIDAVLACGAVMLSSQAEAFGFPNPVIGIAGFAILGTLGVVATAGLQLPRWMWIGIQVGVTFAIGFVIWLFIQTVYDIKALCPYCMAVWVAAIVAFHYTTLHNLGQGNIPIPGALRPLASGAIKYHGVVLLAWFAIPAVLIGIAFADHWKSLF